IVAGTGVQGRAHYTGGDATKVGLNSPWDLLIRGDRLFIAMAGHHQIWVLDLGSNQLAPFAGNGREDIRDGLLLPDFRRREPGSSFAQPSGLASDGKRLYVADSEVSAVRSVPLAGGGEVETLVGSGLFDFGDVDTAEGNAALHLAAGLP